MDLSTLSGDLYHPHHNYAGHIEQQDDVHNSIGNADERERAKKTFIVRSTSVPSSKDERLVSTVVQSSPHLASPTWFSRLRDWWPELLACFGILASLAAIIVTLAISKDKPLPELPFSISLNTIISFESTVFKGFLTLIIATIIGQAQWIWFTKSRSLYDVVRFDNAGRGPYGSLLWILKHHIRSPLTSLAAIIMILALVVDPFVQQLVSYVGCEGEMTGLPAEFSKATIPRTNYYSPPTYHISIGAAYIKVPIDIQNVISAGVEGTPQTVGFGCYSGNCTFSEPYSTLGFCHYCEDLSDQVRFNESYRNSSDGTVLDGAVNITSYLPDGFSITSYAYTALENYRFTSLETPLMSMRLNDTTWAEFIVAKTVRSGCDDGSTNGTWACQGSGAAKCTLRPCVKTFQAHITGNEITETLLEASDPMLDWGGGASMAYVPGDNESSNYVNGLLDLRCISEADRNLVSMNHTFNSTQRWLPFDYKFSSNQSLMEPPPYPGSMVRDGCLYLFQTFMFMSLYGIFLSSYFNGTLSGTVQATEQLINAVGPRILEKTYDQTNGTFALLDSTFEGIATYMTNYIRQNGNAQASRPVEGIVLHYATCVRVRWEWLAFPVALASITIILFVWIVIVVFISRTPTWRSSPLAFMFRGPGDLASVSKVSTNHQPASMIESDSLEDFESVARNITVKLGRSNNELRLEDHTSETRK